ncbi:MAG: diguanylate cyclase [Actinobacteria bacterium]|nr:diguanylate cyclase [Actinomycetota bacterium]
MDPFPSDESVSARGGSSFHSSQLYLYRLLQLAASPGDPGSSDAPLSYPSVKKLAARLGVSSNERLIALFRDFGMGRLELEVSRDRIIVTLFTSSGAKASSAVSSQGCDMERGLIDGALELIVGVPVSTAETDCQSRGASSCRFEAVADRTGASARFVPVMPAITGSGADGGIAGAGFSGLPHGSGLAKGSLQSWFMDLVARELSRSRRHGRQLTFMYVDLDDLGRINDTHGRAAGDQVIKAVGAALSRGCRTEDFLWHHGEDEFALLLSETGADGAHVVARRLSTQVLAAAEYVDVAARISASIGFSTFPVHAESVHGLFDSARSAVYLAKSLGKGRAQVARRTEGDGKAAADGAAARMAETPGKSGTDERAGAGEARSEVTGAQPDRQGSGGSDSSATVRAEVSDPTALEKPVASVVIASSSPLLMAGIRHVFGDAEGFEIVAEVSDAGRLPLVVSDQRPDLIFADMEMATDGDFAVLKLMQKQNLPCKFSAFAADVDQDVIKLAADYAVDGVVMQDSAPKEVMSALTRIFEGKTVLPGEVQEAMKELNKNRRLLEELSEREIEVLRLVAEGKSNAQISNELFITVNTVRFHLANIYQKLSVSNRTEAANYYLRQDLGPDGQTRLL